MTQHDQVKPRTPRPLVSVFVTWHIEVGGCEVMPLFPSFNFHKSLSNGSTQVLYCLYCICLILQVVSLLDDSWKPPIGHRISQNTQDSTATHTVLSLVKWRRNMVMDRITIYHLTLDYHEQPHACHPHDTTVQHLNNMSVLLQCWELSTYQTSGQWCSVTVWWTLDQLTLSDPACTIPRSQQCCSLGITVHLIQVLEPWMCLLVSQKVCLFL